MKGKSFVVAVAALSLVAGVLYAGGKQEKAAGEAAATGPIVTWMWGGTAEEKEVMSRIIDEFDAESDLPVELVFAPGGEDFAYEDKVNAAAAAGELPDVLSLDGPIMANWAWTGILHPLDEYFTDAELKPFTDVIIEQGTWNGKLYALGSFSSTVILAYNPELIEQASIDSVPSEIEDMWGWDEFVANLQKVKDNLGEDIIPFDVHLDWGPSEWNTYGFAPMIWSNGGRLINPDGTATGAINGPKAVEAMRKFQSLFQQGYSPVDPESEAFEKGMVAFALFLPNTFTKWNEQDVPYRVAPYPRVGEDVVSPTGSWAFGITQQSDQKEAAVEVLKAIVSQEAVMEWSSANKMPPARSDAFQSMEIWQEMPYELAIEQEEQTARIRPVTPGYAVLTTNFAQASHNIALGGDVQEILDNLARAVDREYDRRRGYKPFD